MGNGDTETAHDQMIREKEIAKLETILVGHEALVEANSDLEVEFGDLIELGRAELDELRK